METYFATHFSYELQVEQHNSWEHLFIGIQKPRNTSIILVKNIFVQDESSYRSEHKQMSMFHSLLERLARVYAFWMLATFVGTRARPI
jgi:hypothetical protein